MTLFQLVTHGTAGDVLPFLRIGATLRRRGHDVILITHAPYRETAVQAGLDFAPLDQAESYQSHLANTPDMLNAREPTQVADFIRREGLFDQMRLEIDIQTAHHRPGDTVYVGRHTSGASTLFVGELTGAPTVWVAVAPSQPLVVPMAVMNCEDATGEHLNQIRAQISLPTITDWAGWFDSADLTIGLWPEWFDRAGVPAPPPVKLTGFVLGDDAEPAASLPPEVARALDAPEPPILLTGGTGRLLHPRFYPAAVAAVAETGRAGLLVTPHRDLVPDPLPPQIQWFPRLPFATVLPRVAALLHHGGIGTAVRAMRSGTPQVMMAQGADRPDNGQRLAAHGLGAWAPLPRWTPEHLAGQLREQISHSAQLRRAVQQLDGVDDSGPDAAVDALEAAPRRDAVLR